MELLSNLIVFVLIFSVFSVVFSMSEHRVAWEFVILALPFFAMYVMRRWVRNVPAFVTGHVVLIALPFLMLSDMALAVIAAVFMVVAAIFSVLVAIKGELRFQLGQIIGIVSIIAAAHIMSNVMANRDNYHLYGLDLFTRASILLVMAAGVVYIQMDNLHANLRVFGTAGEADSNVFRNNNRTVSGFSAVLVIVAVAMMVLGPAMAMFMRFLGAIANLLMQLPIFFIPAQRYGDEAIVDLYGVPTAQDVYDEIWGDEEVSVEVLTEWPWYVFAAILFVFVVISIALMAMGVGRALANRKRRDEGDDIIISEDELVKMKFSARDLAMFFPKLRANIKHPLRRAYIKKVRGHMKQGVDVQHHHTPDAIADLIRQREDIDGLTGEYEAVRYGGRE